MTVRIIIFLLCLSFIDSIQAQIVSYWSLKIQNELAYHSDTLFTGIATRPSADDVRINGIRRSLLPQENMLYENGEFIKSQRYYRNGQLCEEHNYEGGMRRVYSEDGTLEYSKEYSRDDVYNYSEEFVEMNDRYHGRGKFLFKSKSDAKGEMARLDEIFFEDGRILSRKVVHTENQNDYQEYTDEHKKYVAEYGGGYRIITEKYRLKEDYRYSKDSLLLEKDIVTPDSIIHEYYEKGILVKREAKERYLLYSSDGTVKKRQELHRMKPESFTSEDHSSLYFYNHIPGTPFPKELSDRWQIIDRASSKLSALIHERGGSYFPEDTLKLTDNERAALREDYINAYGWVASTEQSPYDLSSWGADPWRDSNGGPYKVTATSTLNRKKYSADNLMDERLDQAWVEGTKGYGIGEKMTFYFTNHSPRVTQISIHNGYTKTDQTWIENARVKELKVYVNNIPYLVFELEDGWLAQTLLLPEPLGRFPIEKCAIDNILEVDWYSGDFVNLNYRVWTIALEIMSVYPGEKYEDTAISEIGFYGIDATAYCIAEGALVACPGDSGTKPIETLTTGDEVYCYDTANQTIGISKIKTICQVSHDHLVRLSTQESALLLTEGHPVYIEGKGWCSINPTQTLQSYPSFGRVAHYQKDDYILIVNNRLTTPQRIERIEPIHRKTNTYSIELENGNAIIANGIVVGATF